ncbi:unnamed protein product [Caretta caretta]
MDGAGSTGGIIGGIIAAIVAVAVVATGVLIFRQQQKNRTEQDNDDLDAPPAYKPPPPQKKIEDPELVSNPPEVEVENIPLKAAYFEPSIAVDPQEPDLPRYHELPTLEDKEPATMGPSLEDEYLDQINPIYDALSFASGEGVPEQGFIIQWIYAIEAEGAESRSALANGSVEGAELRLRCRRVRVSPGSGCRCCCRRRLPPTMGNVLAASSPTPSPTMPSPGSGLVSVPPGFTMPPVSGLGPPAQERLEEKGDRLPNPGTFEECHRKCKELFPIQMEGVKLTVNKGLSNHFQVNHSVALSTVGDSNYHFGVTYVGTKQLSPTEAFPVLVGDMDNSGSLNAQIIHQLSTRLRSKVAFQTQQSKFVNWQVDGEYRGEDFTAAVTLGNPDILVGSGILVAHYLQSITPCLALGGELVYHRRPGEEGTVMSLAGKYTAPNWIGTLTVGQAGAHATYYHKANDQLQVGVEFEASTRMQDTSVSFGYQLDLPKANLLFKGSVDSNWIVGAALEKKLLPLPLTLAMGAFLNHRKNKFQCGFGLTIG